MKNNNIKSKRAMITSLLVVLCVLMVGGLYLMTNHEDTRVDSTIDNSNEVTPIVENIDSENEEDTLVVDTGIPDIEVEEIVIEEPEVQKNPKDHQVLVEEVLPKEPEKPVNTPPVVVPVTKDDVEDMTKEPEYEESEVTYTEDKEEPAVESVTDTDTNEESDLVPDSQNPFANPDNAAKPSEVNGEDYYEDGRKPGEGDKF